MEKKFKIHSQNCLTFKSTYHFFIFSILQHSHCPRYIWKYFQTLIWWESRLYLRSADERGEPQGVNAEDNLRAGDWQRGLLLPEHDDQPAIHAEHHDHWHSLAALLSIHPALPLWPKPSSSPLYSALTRYTLVRPCSLKPNISVRQLQPGNVRNKSLIKLDCNPLW